MTDQMHKLSIVRQAKASNISRSGVYYLPHPVSTEMHALMSLLDELHLDIHLLAAVCCNNY
ncbi:hypothetical protein [Pseudovibrio sp. WM33]|uniref:hypothetical protein n=1 Tax=Pseudovibrio sp. WM33 TaxID=1735585 RepID=UPI0007AE9769|nr:hypothetical protein [Pseudovibrio sp. WM33]KZL29192.1 hypothetical protein PsWM33_00216 [Pseudovibrio sp. WM33]